MPATSPSNVIVSCESTQLSSQECALFASLQPWGLILFSRNIESPTQVIALIEQAKNAMQRHNLMVFIDQEGGRVSRLPSNFWRVPPAPTVFADAYKRNPDIGKRACFLNAWLTGIELKELGINANCAPMIDIPQPNAANIISERALGSTSQQVIDLARQIIIGLKRAGVAGVIKHMPGHGRATSDSHLELPKVEATLEDLNELDFAPFRAMNSEAMAMSAHVLYTQVDPKLPATISPTVISKVIRSTIAFDGLLMTDDINMKALSGTIVERSTQALQAGCDIVLHCSGDYQEMKALCSVARELEGEALRRAKVAESIAFAPSTQNSQAEIEEELNTLLNNYS